MLLYSTTYYFSFRQHTPNLSLGLNSYFSDLLRIQLLVMYVHITEFTINTTLNESTLAILMIGKGMLEIPIRCMHEIDIWIHTSLIHYRYDICFHNGLIMGVVQFWSAKENLPQLAKKLREARPGEINIYLSLKLNYLVNFGVFESSINRGLTFQRRKCFA